jgi:hypothetical protein
MYSKTCPHEILVNQKETQNNQFFVYQIIENRTSVRKFVFDYKNGITLVIMKF